MQRHYCRLFLHSDHKNAPERVLAPSVLGILNRSDNQSTANLARAQYFRTIGFIQRSDLPRYSWSFDSREKIGVNETDPFVHVSWLLSQLNSLVHPSDYEHHGIEVSLAFYWGGNGTGGGPYISSKLAELLVQHKIGLDVGFYYEKV